MSDRQELTGIVVRSAVVGLALAFVVVLLRPDIVGTARRAPDINDGYASAVAASAPAVVTIFTESRLDADAAASAVPVRGGFGSGVLVSPMGYIVTNWHVIADAERFVVQLADGRLAVPRIVGADPDTELAVLAIDLPDLPHVALGQSDRLRVGDIVLAIGNSIGLSQTVTMGIVSATGRGRLNLTTFEDFIQTDAAINIGNSGGALVNTRGELVGINTAVASANRRLRSVPEGIGFAIPVNLVRGVLAQLVEHGRVIRGFLGVEPTDLSRREATSLGLDGPAVLLQRVWGPAADAGLVAGDILTHIDGQRVVDGQQAMNLVAASQPGQRMRIRVERLGTGTLEFEAVLTERPAPNGAARE
jgi:S1-C subfamily serine protease